MIKKQAHKLKMPVGLLLFRVLFLLSQQIVQYLRHLCAGRAACGIELAITAGNCAGLDQSGHGFGCPVCHIALVSEVLQGLVAIGGGQLVQLLQRVVQQSEHFLSGDSLFRGKLIVTHTIGDPLGLGCCQVAGVVGAARIGKVVGGGFNRFNAIGFQGEPGGRFLRFDSGYAVTALI